MQKTAKPEGQLTPPQVVLWPDTWNNYYHPQTLAAAEKILTQAGFRVQIPKSHICCGRALYDFGLLGAARAYLARVFDRMAAEIDAGLPFIFLEPSCASVFRDEALELFPNNARAQRMSRQVWLLADWSGRQSSSIRRWSSFRRADSSPWPLPPQSRLRRSGERGRPVGEGRRNGRAYRLRLLRHGRAVWF
jgi:hypothetical protein